MIAADRQLRRCPPAARQVCCDRSIETQELRPGFEARREGDEQAPDRSGDANRTLSAFHYYSIWKVFDGLIDAAFYGKRRNYALGHRHEQRFMGLWSDGVPVKGLLVTQYP
jgi:hypothetical protein